MTEGVRLPLIDSKLVGSETLHQPTSHSYSGLSGPSYSVPGYSEKFKLPPTKVLKPGVENKAGHLESWPAHAINTARSNLSIGQNSSLQSSQVHIQHSSPSQASSEKKTHVIPKPKFLAQLEAYLSKELRLLGCPSFGPHELRLQAHKEVFEYLIEDFKTYKGLLSAIKNEYDLYLEYQEEIIKELKPTRVQLETVREDCERKILSMKEDTKQEETGVHLENKRLTAVIDKMREEELSYQSQVEKLQGEIAVLYENFLRESDARKVLLGEYNDIKYRQQEQKSDDDGAGEDREDPVVLKLKLTRAREDLRTSNQRINTMLADYGDVVPRREYEMLETSCNNLEIELDTLKIDHASFMAEHSTLQSIYKEIQSERDRLVEELADLKRSATPRPEWSRCGIYIEGGPERWSELSEGRDSERMLDILLAQMTGKEESEVSKGQAFNGKGIGDNIPRYLRVEGSVKNRRITINELNQLINGYWQHRLITDQDPPLPHDEDLFLFLLARRENDDLLAIEDGYNLHDACTRFAHESHVTLFLQVLRGELMEEVFHNWLHFQTSLTEAFSQHQTDQGVISEDMAPKIMESVLLGKPQQSLKQLYDSAVLLAHESPDNINFASLLSPDDRGCPSKFSLLLLEQYRKESKMFVEEIATEFGSEGVVNMNEVQAVLQKLDPDKCYEDRLLLLAKVFSVSLEIISEDKSGLREITTPTSLLLEQMNKIGVFRSGTAPH